MRNLLNFLAKYNHVIVFILLESLALYLIFGADNYHNIKFYKGFRGLSANIEKSVSNSKYYFGLREVNDRLATENNLLKDSLTMLTIGRDYPTWEVTDTLRNRQYHFFEGEVVNNSVNRQKNYITINRGQKEGIEKDMAVISSDGVVGIIVGSSKNYSVAMSLLNIDMKMSARIKSNGYFGSLSWDGLDYLEASLSEIPQHVPINVGDTIETSGFSSIFPEGIMVGVISDYSSSGSDFYDISVRLSVDFKKLRYINIIGNTLLEERAELESSFE
jgi:rod shape-determining protein MreC